MSDKDVLEMGLEDEYDESLLDEEPSGETGEFDRLELRYFVIMIFIYYKHDRYLFFLFFFISMDG